MQCTNFFLLSTSKQDTDIARYSQNRQEPYAYTHARMHFLNFFDASFRDKDIAFPHPYET